MSLNDPHWGNGGQNNGGKRPKDNPPDLEELWRDLNKRFFGGRKPSGSDGGGNAPKIIGASLTLLIMLVSIIWLASGFYIVDASERALVLRFGQYKESTGAGPHWRLPYPIESHFLVNVSGVRTVEIGYRGSSKVPEESLMLTDDENIVNIQFAVQYIIKNEADYVFQNKNPDEAVKQAAETAIREIVGKSKMNFVLYEGREQIAARASELIQNILDRYETGIQVSKVTMQNAQPPEQVQAAFDDAVKAKQDRERQKNEGEAYANQIIPFAKGQAARLKLEADAYKDQLIATAEGEASRFSQLRTEYAKAPEVTRSRLYYEAMQDIYKNTSKVYLDTKGNGNLLYLPLDKLLQAQPGSAEAGLNPGNVNSKANDQAKLTVSSKPIVSNDLRSRAALQSRSREVR